MFAAPCLKEQSSIPPLMPMSKKFYTKWQGIRQGIAPAEAVSPGLIVQLNHNIAGKQKMKSAKEQLDEALAKATGEAPDSKRLLDEALAKATEKPAEEKPKPYHQGCLACSDMGVWAGKPCEYCNGTGGY